ncbi:hypothetical protein Aduo_019915 [Ancylostoma duodenale]
MRLFNGLPVLLLTIVLLGSFAPASPRRRLSSANHRLTQDFVSDGELERQVTPRLPDVISVTAYYVKILPYYPAPGIYYDKGRNMTFDGSVLMFVWIKKPTLEITLNAVNLAILSVMLADSLNRPVGTRGIRINNDTEQLSIVLERQPAVGSMFVLTITYTGRINPYNVGGLYYTSYTDSSGEVHWMVATFLEPSMARAIFPCIDEPASKAAFQLDIVYPSSHVALGNMKETPPVDLGNGWSMVSFPPTPVISTYLIAFAAGPFVSHSLINKDGTLVRSWGWTGQENFLKFSAETAAECLYQMGLYTKIKFPLEKCDHLGLPEHGISGMENFGLVIYKNELIAYNPYSLVSLQEWVAEISTQSPSPWNYSWIIPLRSAQLNSASSKIHWLVPEAFKEWNCSLNNVNGWQTFPYSSVTYGRFFYDDNSFYALLKKMTTEDVPVEVKLALLMDEIALSSSLKYVFLFYAVKYSVGDAASRAQALFKRIMANCISSISGSAWCSGVPNDIHRAVYCGAAKYDNNAPANFEHLMFLYSGEVKTNLYYSQEYTALLEGMSCAEQSSQLNA